MNLDRWVSNSGVEQNYKKYASVAEWLKALVSKTRLREIFAGVRILPGVLKFYLIFVNKNTNNVLKSVVISLKYFKTLLYIIINNC